MRAVKAKALRKALGFHPATPREYEHDKPTRKGAIGTIKATGPRRSYQAVKRNHVLTTAVLRAA